MWQAPCKGFSLTICSFQHIVLAISLKEAFVEIKWELLMENKGEVVAGGVKIALLQKVEKPFVKKTDSLLKDLHVIVEKRFRQKFRDDSLR